MAVVAKIDFPSYNSSVLYVVTYKKAVDAAWITPPGNPTTTFPFYISNLDENTTYDFKVETDCGIWTTQETTGSSVLYVWVENTFTCEQDSPFTLADTYTGFSSPQGIFWDQTSGLFYVVDVDDTISNVWTFDPDTITGFGSANHIVGTNAPVGITSASHAFDAVNRRIWISGDDSGGARVLDIASGNWTLLSFGSDGTGGSARRSPLILSSDTAYCFSASPNEIRTFDLVTLAPVATINKATIPSSSTYMVNAYGVAFVGSEAWVYAGQRPNGNIAVYNSDFTSLLTTINLPDIATPGSPWVPNPSYYWQSHYYDSPSNRWYVSDTGSNQIIIIDTVTRAIVNKFTISNLRGRNHASAAFFRNELTDEIFAAVACENEGGDIAVNNKLYRINDTGITYIYPDESVTLLRLRQGTTEAFGVASGLVKWQGGSWNTDGLIFKYTL